LTFRHFLLLLEIDYQKFLSLGVVLKIRSDQFGLQDTDLALQSLVGNGVKEPIHMVIDPNIQKV
jgi:hypothetical protein